MVDPTIIPMTPMEFKLKTYAMVIVASFCFFVIIKLVKELGGLREFIRLMRQDEGEDEGRSGTTPLAPPSK